MATKIPRQTHKIFGANGPTTNFAEFGSLVANSPLKTKDLATIMALPAWNDGFQDAIYGANKNLLLQDLNSALYEPSTQIGYILQAGVPEWDANTPYFKGSIVQRTDGSGNATGELYVSAVDNNLNQALPVQTNNANWTYLNPATLPPGVLIDFMGLVSPAGFLIADGTAYSRTTYANLFNALTLTLAGNLTSGQPQITNLASTTNLKPGHYASGVGVPSGAQILTVDSSSQVTLNMNASSSQTPGSIVFGSCPLGDGSTTFNVPDSRRRTTVGAGGSGTATLDSRVGATGGEETHVLTVAEMPSHTHPESGWQNGVPGFAGGSSGSPEPATTGATGGGGAHNNMQPSLVATKIIKY